jgi:hypothetical protein
MPPMELCPAHVCLVSLHMFCGPAWFCIEPCSTVLHVLLCIKKNMNNGPTVRPRKGAGQRLMGAGVYLAFRGFIMRRNLVWVLS